MSGQRGRGSPQINIRVGQEEFDQLDAIAKELDTTVASLAASMLRTALTVGRCSPEAATVAEQLAKDLGVSVPAAVEASIYFARSYTVGGPQRPQSAVSRASASLQLAKLTEKGPPP